MSPPTRSGTPMRTSPSVIWAPLSPVSQLFSTKR